MPLIAPRDAHRYDVIDEPLSPWNGSRLISVTDTLRICRFVNTDWFTDEARARGAAIHRSTELWETVGLDIESLRPEWRGYHTAWERFVSAMNWESTLIEEAGWSPIHGFAGRLDRVGRWKRGTKEVLCDIKTGGCPRWVGMQLAGYRELLPVLPRDVVAVTLYPDARYDITPFEDRKLDDERRHFLAAVAVARRLRDWGLAA